MKSIGTLRLFDFAQDSSSTAFSSEPVEESGRTDNYLDSNEAIPFVVSAVEPRNVSQGTIQQTQTEPLPARIRRHALYVFDGAAA